MKRILDVLRFMAVTVSLSGLLTGPAGAATFNVRTQFGGKGDDIADDTVAARNAIAAAVASNPTPDNPAVVYFPSGHWNLCMQVGDPVNPALKNFPCIFTITTSNLVFQGDGPGKTILSGWMPGLKDPKTTFTQVSPSAYAKCIRFGMFRLNSSLSMAGISNITLSGLEMTGNSGYDGNFTVGCVYATGKGWDISHKCLAFDGNKPISNLQVLNCSLHDWQGEIIYGGGTAVQSLAIDHTTVYGSNGSAISVSGDTSFTNSQVGGPHAGQSVYNGFENFCFAAGQKTVITNSLIQCSASTENTHGIGCAYIGGAGNSLSITKSAITKNHQGLLLNVGAMNVTVQGNAFATNDTGIQTTATMTIKGFPGGFDKVLVDGNIFVGGNYAFLNQNPVSNLTISNNSVTGGCLLSGNYLVPPVNMVVTGNTLAASTKDINGYQGHGAGLWSKTARPTGTGSIGSKVDDFTTSTTTLIYPVTDLMLLNSNTNKTGKQIVQIDPTTLSNLPTGFTFKLIPGSKNNWLLKSDPTWNNFTNDVSIGSGVTVTKQASGVFGLAP